MLKVSVIIPVYNVEKYLGKCIDSILNQTVRDCEIILIDDGSKDSSGEIADNYAAKYSNIKVIHKENGGQAGARNIGLDNSEGEYICFVDSDDWLEENYFGRLLEVAKNTEADIVQCGYCSRVEGENAPEVIAEADMEMTGIEAIDRIYSKHNVEMVVIWNKLYKRAIFDGLRFEEGMIHEDEALVAQMYYRAEKMVFISDRLYNYRVDNTQSTMGKSYSIKHLDMIKALEIRMDFYKDKALNDYYEKDSFKYLYKILLNINDIKKLQGNYSAVIKELKNKYWAKYHESLSFSWSVKRKAGMLFFGVFPAMYKLRYKPGAR